MTAAELRAVLEEQGCALDIVGGRLSILAPKPLDDDLRREVRRRKRALTELVMQYPCRGCGRDPSLTPLACHGCRKRARRASTQRQGVA